MIVGRLVGDDEAIRALYDRPHTKWPTAEGALQQHEVWHVAPNEKGNPRLVGRTPDETFVRAIYDKTYATRWADVPADRRWSDPPESLLVEIPADLSPR